MAQLDRIEGEKRQVTVLFCDLAEYTPLIEKHCPEEAYGLMDLQLDLEQLERVRRERSTFCKE
jgi:class 3 adenylate cyclase